MQARWKKLAVAAATVAGTLATSLVATEKPAAAQEIQLTGPLAGAPAVRRLRQYRDGRFELALGSGFTLLDEYQRTIFVAGRLQYNIFDWLGIGAFGGYGVASLNTDLTDKIDTTAPRNSRTAINLPPRAGQPGGQAFDKQTGQQKLLINPQVTFAPFRGKLAFFQKLFIDTDLYVHGGLAITQVQERASCAVGACSATNPNAFKTDTRMAFAPSFGLGLSLYATGFLSVNVEYRAYPFSWNRGGFDSRGGGPDASFPDNKIDSEDQTFKFNQMVFVGVGFYLPTKPKISD